MTCCGTGGSIGAGGSTDCCDGVEIGVVGAGDMVGGGISSG